MQCTYYRNQSCRSCQWLNKPYQQQIIDKQDHLISLLSHVVVNQWLPAITSPEIACRNKAKMVVSGSVERPVLGIINEQGEAVDLCHCPLYGPDIQAVFPLLKTFIAKAGLVPYNIERKRGELKYILLTESRFNRQLMLRFVLRSDNKLEQLKKALVWLREQLPQLTVISANIQPVHMAILEGDIEYPLSEQQTLEERFNAIPLFIRPRSFFQTNPIVAEKLYATAKQWVNELNINSLWDLFCGVGGFGLHCTNKERKLIGIEINAEAIRCAQQSADMLGLDNVEFRSLDSTKFAEDKIHAPDIILVNPPRRGLGLELCHYLSNISAKYILYSSCNAATMVKDLQRLNNYHIGKIQLFDMFPHTAHYEAMVLLINR